MKKLLLLAVLVCTFFLGFSQEEARDVPYSWNHDERSTIPVIGLEQLDLEGIREEDAINDLDKGQPWRYGITRSLTFDLESTGVWTPLPNGGRLWQVAVNSPAAINLSFNFSEFYLPEGAQLYFYNEDRSDVSRKYTKKNNRDSNILGSWFIQGETVFIEYYEPSITSEIAKLTVAGVIHGYRLDGVEDFVDETRGLNDSGDCNYDVNCPIGDDFDEKKDMLKKTVALLNLGNGYLCSASLVNNTTNDKTPYLLTGNHCLENSDPALWSIRFNWMSPSPVCGSGDESTDIETNFTMSGAELRASNALSDFALVELYNAVPEVWDVAFAGWDNSDDLPSFEVGIHHPNGDIMKISRDDTGAVRENANGTEVWLIGGVSVGSGDGWEIGTTESGSSGSPLFNQDGRLIGQLYAGQSVCNGIENNNDYDIYGRFAVSWDVGTTPETRLKDWLDPSGSGATTLNTIQNLLSSPDNTLIGTLDIYPNPATTFITVENFRYPDLSYQLFNVTGQQLSTGSISNTFNLIDVQSYVEGVYFLYVTDNETQETITKKVIINR